MKDIRARLTLLYAGVILISLVFTALCFARIDPKTVAGAWLFDEGSGDIAEDSSESKNDGDLKWVDGKFGKATILTPEN